MSGERLFFSFSGLFSSQIGQLVREPCGMSGLKIFPLRKILGETLVSKHIQLFKILGAGVLALVPWPDASLSQRISLKDLFLEFKPRNLKDSCTLTHVFLFFPPSRNSVCILLL